MSESAQKIFRNSCVTDLRYQLKEGDALASYFEGQFSVPPGCELDSAIKVEGSPKLKVAESGSQADLDFENAVRLYEAYSDINEVQASDARLWTYLTHVTFRKYTMARWPAGSSFAEATSGAAKKATAINKVLSHWFVAERPDRALRRHALARLWWAVHLTIAPWKHDPQYYSDFDQTSDPYIFTRALFSTQDVYQQVLERGIGRDNRILIAVLGYVAGHDALKREEIRDLMKELNLMSSVQNLSVLPRSELGKIVDGVSS